MDIYITEGLTVSATGPEERQPDWCTL